jgi:hypothetical protein
LASILANLEVSKSKYALLYSLADLTSQNLDNLEKIMSEWNFESAKLVLDKIQERTLLIKALERKLDDPNTDEVNELQPLFEKSLWIFGPAYETIEYTANLGMTKVIEQLFGKQGISGSRNRPDFAILTDSSVGLYSYPSYDENRNPNGVDRLTIVELKRPSITINSGHKEQCWKYVSELIEKGILQEWTRVDCFVVGKHVKAVDRDADKRRKDTVIIEALDYSTILSKAEARLLNLYKEVKSMPFVDQERIEEYNKKTEFEAELFTV